MKQSTAGSCTKHSGARDSQGSTGKVTLGPGLLCQRSGIFSYLDNPNIFFQDTGQSFSWNEGIFLLCFSCFPFPFPSTPPFFCPPPLLAIGPRALHAPSKPSNMQLHHQALSSFLKLIFDLSVFPCLVEADSLLPPKSLPFHPNFIPLS